MEKHKKQLRTDLDLRSCIGDRMRRAREEANLSAEEVAKKLGVAKTTVGYWESGRSFPSVEHLMALVRLYRVNADWVLESLPEDVDGEDDVRRLVVCYRRLEPIYRRAILATALAMLGSCDDSDEAAELAS